MFFVDDARPHLGGYIIGGDDATYYPALWRWLVEQKEVRSVIDVGCGEGHAVSFFEELGCDVIGVDGVEQDNPQIVCHDYTEGSWPQAVRGNRMEGASDLVWSCEFVEHIEERCVPNFLETFLMAPLVLMTHAAPGQQGHHHVNCQPEAYWRGVMAAIGYELDDALTQECRGLAARNRNQWNHFARSGLAFVRSLGR